MNPTQLENKPNQTPGKAKRKGYKPRSSFSLWWDEYQCRQTVKQWKHDQKKAERRRKRLAMLDKIPYSRVVGDVLYMVGFWVEYVIVCFTRKATRVIRAVSATAATLLLLVLRPFVSGLATLWQDLTRPFVRFFLGIRHMNELVETLPEDDTKTARKVRRAYLLRGVRRYLPLVWNALTYFMPLAAAAALVVLVRTGLEQTYVLNVQVNGQTVGYVESEQVFENAREDVQSRINNAKTLLAEAGSVVPDTQWDISPTYTLTVGGQTMTESEIANAILRTTSDEIVDGTAVYIDDELCFVTTEGDHLRTYLEAVKDPYEDALSTNRRVGFAHDIRLLDGVYLQDSILPYSQVVSTLNEGNEVLTYTVGEEETVQTVVENTGVTFDSLAALNQGLDRLDQELEPGTQLITGVASAELLKVKVVERAVELEDIPYEEQNSESDEYDFGKTVTIQEGEIGSQEVTYDYTYIDGSLVSKDVVNINVTKQAVPEITVTGTKLKSGMVASVGTGQFIWPVPGYKYVSRWASAYHRGADICAAYGTPIYASDGGVVTEAGYHYSWGNYVKINHGNGYETLYAHMSSIAVSVGQSVSQRQVIGYVGSTGNSTGNHCHFEMYYNGVLFSAQTLFGGM